MDINFYDNSDNDRPVLREDVRIRDIQLDVSPEGRRVAVEIQLTPFIERPTLRLQLTNGRGEPSGSLTVIETMAHVVELVLHLRDRQPQDPYTLDVIAYYASLEDGKREVVHQQSTTFTTQRDANHS